MKKLLAAVVAFCALSGPGLAADMPVKAPVYKAPPAAASAANFYFWVDGMYDSVRLPTYSLGFHNVAFGNTDIGTTVQNFAPRLDGGGVRGAFGYVIPGTSARVEVGGSYLAASGTSPQTTTTSTVMVNAQRLDGGGTATIACNQAFFCTTAGSLSTSYAQWQINGKVAADWRAGGVIVTPSAALFGGDASVNQGLFQALTQVWVVGGAVNGTGTYTAHTTLNSTDFGGRVGLDLSIPFTDAFTFGIGGWAGEAARSTSLTGSDAATSAPFPNFNGNSTISTSASKSVFLANAEGGFAYAWTPAVTLRAFAGLSYDNGVAGITNPLFAGPSFAPTATTPARIYFASETSYYAGGGVLVRF